MAGFRVGARGRNMPEWTGAMAMGCAFGFKAWSEAEKYRDSRMSNLKRKKSLQTSKEREQPTTNIQQPAMGVPYEAPYGTPYVKEDQDIFASGAMPQTPPESRKPYEACEGKFTQSEPSPEVMPYFETPQGKAALAKREAIKARLAEKAKHVS
jgi:hypothetical protein